MQVELQELEPCKVALSIQIPPEQVAQTLDRVFSEAVKQAAVPGFRKGKAPRKLAERYIDGDVVRQVALDRLLNEAYKQALDEKGLNPLPSAEPEVEVGEYQEGEPLSFKATVPLRPTVELGSFEGIELRRVVVPITDADVDREMSRLVEGAAHYHDTEEGAGEGDRVLANVQISVDGQVVDDASASNAWLIVGNNFPDFDTQVNGIRPGESREFTFTYPADFSVAERAGKEAQTTVEALRVQHRHVPELDDEFAASLGAGTVEELRQRVREDLERQASQQADDFLESELIEKVVDRSTVHFPQSMVDEEVAEKMRDLMTRLDRRKLTLEDYLESREKDLATLENELAQEGRQRVANTLVLSQIASEQGITVTDQDVEEDIQRRAERTGTDVSVMRGILERQGELETVRNAVFLRKVLGYLKSVSVIHEE